MISVFLKPHKGGNRKLSPYLFYALFQEITFLYFIQATFAFLFILTTHKEKKSPKKKKNFLFFCPLLLSFEKIKPKNKNKKRK